MKKLIAQRPVRYMGRTYARGDTLPAHEARMVNAWLNAGTAAWRDGGRTAPEPAQKRLNNEHLAADALRSLGIAIETDAGEYVGDENIVGQFRTICCEGTQEMPDEQGQTGKPAGSFDVKQLSAWKNADLEKLAKDLGVDISAANTKAERAQMIAAATAQCPAEDAAGQGEEPQ